MMDHLICGVMKWSRAGSGGDEIREVISGSKARRGEHYSSTMLEKIFACLYTHKS
jgi:hypothetical protein